MAYIRKTRDIWKIYVKYDNDNGWEHELTEYSYASAKKAINLYRKDEPKFTYKITKSRERIEDG